MRIQQRLLFQPSNYFLKNFCKTLIIAPFIMTISSCNNSTNKNQSAQETDTANYTKGTFGYDLDFLKQTIKSLDSLFLIRK